MSDSNKLARRHLVIGTAGHIDHGKTTLLRALTGVDTDRLPEEKERGISIDLGFAHLELPDGFTLSFVDVPGHENFVKNMLAGASGVSAAMLVIAANEGIMPQTREHFDICRLLNIQNGLIAITKIDTVASSELEQTISSVRELCRGSFLDGKPIVAVSAETGEGLQSLRASLIELAADQQTGQSHRLARLAIDRSFSVKGFGTVVTGTLREGCLKIGEHVVIHPTLKAARIRGLRSAGKEVELAKSGERVAVNLAGVYHAEIHRGMTLTHPGPLASSSLLDATVEWLEFGQTPQSRQQFLLHAGAAEIPVSLKILSPGKPFARIWLSRPALLFPDDRFVLRRPSPANTAGGGVVQDIFPPVRLSRTKLANRLSSFAALPWPKQLELLVAEARKGNRIDDLVQRTGRSSKQIKAELAKNPNLLWNAEEGCAFSSTWIERQRTRVLQFLAGFHDRYPELAGAPLAQARLDLESAAVHTVFKNFEAVVLHGDTVALRSHHPAISQEGGRASAALEQKLKLAGYQPPLLTEILNSLGIEPAKARTALENSVKSQRLVRVKDDLVFHADVLDHIRRSLSQHKGRRFSIPEFKEWTQVSRKYAVPLLEYFDRCKVTRRDGDMRVIL